MQNVPYSIWDNSTAKGAKLLRDAHSRILAYHANKSITLPPGTATNLPTQAVVAFWDASVTWVGGGWSSMKVCAVLFFSFCVPNQFAVKHQDQRYRYMQS